MAPEETLKRGRLMGEIQQLLNTYSVEKGSNTPDFLLAEYLMGCLNIYEHVVTKRDQWHNIRTPR